MADKPKPSLGGGKHGQKYIMKTGGFLPKFPSKRAQARLNRYFRQLERRWIEALGGANKITPAQETMLMLSLKVLKAAFAVELWLDKVGIIQRPPLEKGIVEIQPALSKTWISLVNTARQNIQVLGLDISAEEPALTPAEIAAAVDIEMAGKDKVEHVPEAEDAGSQARTEGGGQVQEESAGVEIAREGNLEGSGDE